MNIPKNPVERRAWVIYQLRCRGSSLSQIARQEGVSQQAVSNALMTPSYRLEIAIANAIGVTVEALFPERYDGAYRLPYTRPDQRSTAAPRGNVQEGEAA